MTASDNNAQHYLSCFEKQIPLWERKEPKWLLAHRQEAIRLFSDRGFPTIREEAWKNTPLGTLTKISFGLNGHTAPHLKIWGDLSPGAIMTPLKEAVAKFPDLVQKYLKPRTHNPFVLLNDAFMEEGAFIYLPRGTKNNGLIRLDHTAPGNRLLLSPRNLIILEEGVSLTVIETYTGAKDASSYWTNQVTEIFLGPACRLDHYRLQKESPESFNFGSLQVHQEKNSTFESHSISLGSALSRYEMNIELDGEDSKAELRGLLLGHQKQLMDHHIRVEHLKPKGTSSQLFKGIFDGEAKGIINGIVVVHDGAQFSDARQQIKSLLLSDKAESLPEPQLKILNNDVKCSHGASVGQLDKNALFYLCSRGISEEEAKGMLIFAFANDVLERIKQNEVKTKAHEYVSAYLKKTG